MTDREYLPMWHSRRLGNRVIRCMPAPSEKFPCDHCIFQAANKKDDTCTKPLDWSGCTAFNRRDRADVIFVRDVQQLDIKFE